MLLDDAINAFSNAIATAEGFFVSGSRPQRNNNPGDLTVDTTGTGVGKDGPFIVYGSAADGWTALNKQVQLILTDASNVYNSDMTLRDIASIYTATDQSSWMNTVASVLGISVDVPINTLLDPTAILETGAGIGAGVLLLFVAFWFLSKRKG